MLSMPRIVRPDLFRSRGTEIGSPAEPALADPLSETKNWWKFLSSKSASQAGNRNRPNSEVDQPRSANQTRSPYVLQRTLYHLDIGYRPCGRRHSETVDAGKRSRRLYHHHSARDRRR